MHSVVVGTHVDCNLRLPGPFLSPRHFEIFGEPGFVMVRDLGSTNGTMVKTALMKAWVPAKGGLAIPLRHGGMVVGGRVLIEVNLDGRVRCKPGLTDQDMEDLFLGALI